MTDPNAWLWREADRLAALPRNELDEQLTAAHRDAANVEVDWDDRPSRSDLAADDTAHLHDDDPHS